MTTTVHLLPKLAHFVGNKIQSGEFPDIDTLVNEALQEKAERDSAYQKWAHEHISTALAETKDGTAKYADFEVVTDWVSGWGSEGEKPTPVCA
jgi:Arc/MetJ-type ribon-helix-helix transcriptional regulator